MVWNYLVKMVQWFAGFFQDRLKAASSKRATLYIALWMLWQFVSTAVNGGFQGDVNPIVTKILYGVLLIILIGLGAVTSEMVTKIWETKFGKTKDEN